MRDQVIELCQAKHTIPSRYQFESGVLDTLMRIVDTTSLITIIPEMAIEYIPKEHSRQVKSLFKGASSRKIALASRRTYAKRSIVNALRTTIIESKTKSKN
jgi:LysR family hydrogen peroxide-inducible transcriptional activator